MRYLSIIVFSIISIIPNLSYSEIAVRGDPLKKEYHQEGPGNNLFYQTGEIVESYSMICDMGQAIPDPTIMGTQYLIINQANTA